MEDESNVQYYMYAVFVVLGIIGYLIRRILSKKTIAELKNFAESHNYIYHSKVEDKSIVKQLDFPKFYSSVKVYNYLEIPENNWTAIWGDCDREIHAKGAPAGIARSTFFIFNFNNLAIPGLIIPDFEVTDNQGVLDSLGNMFSDKVIKLDNNFSASYNLKGPFETQTKKFFTEKVKKAFLNLDNNHLPDERNLNIKDLGNIITGHFGKSTGVQIYGYNKKIFVFCSEKTTLEARQNFYKIASGIASAIVQDALKTNPSSSDEVSEPQDELSQFIANQENNFNAISKKNQSNNQIPTNSPNISKVSEDTEPQYTAPEQSLAQEQPSVSSPDLNPSPNIVSDAQDRVSPSDQLLLLSAMMIVDKSIHRNELKNILDYGIKIGLERAEIEKIVTLAKDQPNTILRSVQLANFPKDDKLMHMIVRVAFADGKIASEELEFLRLIAKKMNYSNEELKVILEEEKRNFHP